MAIYAAVNSAQREVSGWSAATGGVQRKQNRMTAQIAGVQRDLFATQQWKRYSIYNYFVTSSESSTMLLTSSVSKYASNYKESSKSTVAATALVAGDYFSYRSTVYKVISPITSGAALTVYPVTSYSQGKGSYLDTVSASDPNAYPANGAQGGYWYVKLS